MLSRSSDIPWQRAIVLLTGTAIGIVVVAALYWIQAIFIPFTIAVLLTFILGPLVRLLQKNGLPRVLAVMLAMMLATGFIGSIGWILGRQLNDLVQDLPNYEANIKKKIDYIKSLNVGSGRVEHLFDEISRQWQETPAISGSLSDRPSSAENKAEVPAPVAVSPKSSSTFTTLSQYFGTALAFLGGVVFVLVLTIFMLLNREDLRSRFLRLAGSDQLTLTTKAVDEAFHRISRYLLMQLLLNSTYGLVFAVGLGLIGVKHALLWGVMAAVMRYIPYIGAWIVGALVVLLSVAISDGWMRPIMVMCLFIALETVVSNVLEPLFYGKSIGVSQVALLVAAAFWAFLWGPIGLVLAGPMTVCLVVLGKYVPQLKFIDVLLGDEPALAPDINFYQRLLARDRQEAEDLAVSQAKGAYDGVLVPALTYANKDRDRDELTDDDVQFIHQVVGEIVDKFEANAEPAIASENEIHSTPKIRIVGCASRDEADMLSLKMLRDLLDPALWEIEILSADLLASEMVAAVQEKQPALVCIASLPPGGLSQARYLCKRLRAQVPDVKIIVGRWGLKGNTEQNDEDLKNAGADAVETSLGETCAWLKGRHSILATEQIQKNSN